MLHQSRLKIVILIFCLMIVHSFIYAKKEVKVAVYENQPLSFQEQGKKWNGIFIDIIEYIAEKEGWTIKYVKGTWLESLERIKKGEVDLLLYPTNSNKQDYVDFSQSTLISNYGQVYTNSNLKISSIGDLNGKKIIVLKDNPYYSNYIKSIDKMNIRCETVEIVGGYEDVFKKLEQKEADAAIVPAMEANFLENKYNAKRKLIIHDYFDLKFAVPKGKNQDILHQLDKKVPILKMNSKSIYHQSLQQWLLIDKSELVPHFVKMIGFFIACGFVLFFILHLYSRYQVKKKTKQLRKEIEDRKIAEEKYKDSEDRYRRLVELSPDGIVLVVDGIIEFANNALIKLIGGSNKDDVVGKNFLKFIPESCQPIIHKIQDSLLNGNESVILPTEMRVIKLNGDIVHVESSNSRVIYQDKFAVQAILRDITDRKKAEEKLILSEERYKNLVNFSPNAIAVHQNDTIQFVNPSALDLIGADSKDQIIGESIFRFIHPDFHEKAKELVYKLNSDIPIPDLNEFIILGTNNQIIYAEIASTKINYKNESAILTMIDDVTERKLAEKELISSEERYRKLVELSPDGILVHDGEKIVYYNKAYQDIIGASTLDQIIGQPLLQYIHSDYHNMVRNRIEIMASEKTSIPFMEERFIRVDGSEIDVEVVGSHTIFQGEPAFQIFVRDITERKKAEKELLRYREHLEEVIDEKSQQLLTEQENYRLLVETMNEGLGAIDSEGTLTIVNRRLTEMLDMPIDEIIGKKPYEIFPTDMDEKIFYSKFSMVKDHHQPNQFEIELNRKNGEKLYAKVSPNPIFNNKDQLVGGIAVVTDITDRKKAEDKLRQNENTLRAILTAIPDFLIRLNKDGTIIDYIGKNEESCSRVNTNIQDFLPYDIAHKILNATEQALLTNTVQILEYKNPVDLDQEIEARIVVCGNDEVLMIKRDITERKKMENELRRQEEKYRQLVETMNEGLVMLNKESVITYLNPKMGTMLGYSMDEMIGRPMEQFLDHENAVVLDNQLALITKDLENNYELDLLRKDGTRTSTIGAPKKIYNEDGEHIGSFIVFTEINERKLMEEKLRESEEFFRLITENSSDIISKHAPTKDYEFIYVSPASYNLTGFHPSELIGRSPMDFTHPDDFNFDDITIKKEQMNVYDKTNLFTISYRMRKKDGSYIWLECTIRNIINPFTKEIEGSISSARDVTYRKEAESQLKIKNEELEKSLNEIKRMQNQIVLQEKLASLGSLTAGIAHEIKNPLNFINNFAKFSLELSDELQETLTNNRNGLNQVIFEECVDYISDINQYSKKIFEHGQRADGIVKGMLLHSRASSTRKARTVHSSTARCWSHMCPTQLCRAMKSCLVC